MSAPRLVTAVNLARVAVRIDRGAHVQLLNTCISCGKTRKSPVFTAKKWEAWKRARAQGVHVQSFWPELTPAEREEFFISGMCDACWRRTFQSGKGEP